MKNAFSIVVPAYNSSQWLKPLVTELLRQKEKYPQTEIIVIDDGSTEDMTWLDDLDIITVHQENGGEAVARNRGIDTATGEYLAFVDADDMVVSDYLDIIYEHARKGTDYVVYRWMFADGTLGDWHKESHLWNWNVWSYTFRREILTERFDVKRVYACDYYWLEKQIKPEMTRIEVETPIVIYNVDNPNSLTHLFREGKIGIWKD
jgi:glycosyltransferase involved in cell wall biosynthesis